ncbi:MAG: hypothetical protein V4691_07900 [Pseudomonadota bacterium]
MGSVSGVGAGLNNSSAQQKVSFNLNGDGDENKAKEASKGVVKKGTAVISIGDATTVMPSSGDSGILKTFVETVKFLNGAAQKVRSLWPF